jgi:hypothetical protein
MSCTARRKSPVLPVVKTTDYRVHVHANKYAVLHVLYCPS